MANDKTVKITIEVDGVTQVVDNLDDATKAMDKLGKETKKAGQQATIFDGMKKKFADFKEGVGKVTNSFKGLKGAILATGLGALVVILGSIISYFKNTEEGSRKLAIAMEAFGIIVGKIQDAAAKLGDDYFFDF